MNDAMLNDVLDLEEHALNAALATEVFGIDTLVPVIDAADGTTAYFFGFHEGHTPVHIASDEWSGSYDMAMDLLHITLEQQHKFAGRAYVDYLVRAVARNLNYMSEDYPGNAHGALLDAQIVGVIAYAKPIDIARAFLAGWRKTRVYANSAGDDLPALESDL